MSPEIRFNNELMLDAPDVSGEYKLTNGKKIGVDLSKVSRDNNVNLVYLWEDPFVGSEGKVTDGLRSVPIGRNGVGGQMIKEGVKVEVRLKDNILKKRVKPKSEWPPKRYHY